MGALVAAELMAAPLHAQQRAAPGAGAVEESGTWVELHADDGAVRIERIQNGQAVSVCAAPCRQRLPRDGVYRIAGDGIAPSQKFDLSAERWIRLDVKAGSSVQRDIGFGLAATAAVTLLVATAYYVAAIGETPVDDLSPPPPRRDLDIAAVALGAVYVLGGVAVTLIATSNTKVTTSSGVTFSTSNQLGVASGSDINDIYRTLSIWPTFNP